MKVQATIKRGTETLLSATADVTKHGDLDDLVSRLLSDFRQQNPDHPVWADDLLLSLAHAP